MSEETIHYTLTKVETKELPGRILAALVEAKALGKRLTARQMARRFGYRDDRKIRVAIGKLIDRGYIIVSSVRQPYGYFLADSRQDVTNYIATEFSRIKEMHARIKAIQTSAAKLFDDLEQLPLVLK